MKQGLCIPAIDTGGLQTLFYYLSTAPVIGSVRKELRPGSLFSMESLLRYYGFNPSG